MKQRSLFFLLIIFSFSFHACSLKIPTIYDGNKFGTVKVSDPAPSPLVLEKSIQKLPDMKEWIGEKDISKSKSLEEFLQQHNTVSFLVLKDGKLMYEYYGNGIKEGDITQVFSVTKVFVTSMLGIAIQQGFIKSVNQKVKEILPELDKPGLDSITFFHLIQMQSGLNHDEYGKLLKTLKFYHQENSLNILDELELKYQPGEKFVYKSIDTQILGMCLEKVTGKPFIQYFNEEIWSKIGAQDTVKWSVDRPENGHIKFYGGLNVSARDLAKFGWMCLNDGKYGEQQIIPAAWLNFCDDVQYRNGEDFYCNGWWYNNAQPDENIYFGAGFGGQIMMVNETAKTVIVRLGTNKGGVKWYPIMIDLSRKL